MTRYRIRILHDDDFTPEGSNGAPLPEPRDHYEANPFTPGGGAALSYEAYLGHYGDPQCHVGAGVVVDVMADGDRDWRHGASVWGIDCMYDDTDAQLLDRTFYLVADIPDGYLKETAAELMREVGA